MLLMLYYFKKKIAYIFFVKSPFLIFKSDLKIVGTGPDQKYST
jgi:hypothetical protein